MSAGLPSVDAIAAEIAASTLARPPTLGAGRLVCVDGPAGSGKTTLAAALEQILAETGRVQLLHMDDVIGGWSGLEEGMDIVASDIVAPLGHGEAGHYRPFGWEQMERETQQRVVPPCDVLLIEGVGAGNGAYHDAMTCLVWVEAPSVVRLERGVARDGEHLREQWLAWQEHEDAMFARERTRERADVLVDGTR